MTRSDAPGALTCRAWPRRLAVAVIVVAAGLVALGGAAGAHAGLVSTEPTARAQLAEPPTEIVLHFDEPVEATLGGIRLYDTDERGLAVGTATRVPGDDTSLRAPIQQQLGHGLYVVTWRATSADGHPVAGAFTFQVGPGAATDTSSLVSRLLAAQGGDTEVGVVLAVSRFVGYVGLALVIGGLAFLAAIWPAGARGRALLTLLWAGWAALALGSLGSFLFEGPYGTNRPLTAAFDTDLWRDVADTRFGRALLVRLGATILAGVVVALVRRARQPWWQALAVVTGGVLALSVAFAGHGDTGRLPLAGVVLGALHVAGMSVWLGGLAFLVATLLGRRRALPAASVGAAAAGAAVSAPERPESEVAPDPLIPVAERFSRVAFAAIVVVVVTGLLQAWRLLDGWSSIVDTDYGRLLLVKTGLVVVVLAVASLARRTVQRRWPASGGVLRFVVVEVGLALAILAVTAVLVGSAPPATTAGFQPFAATLAQGDTLVSVAVEPARVGGDNAIHVYVSPPGGSLARVPGAEARLTLPSRDVGPIPVPLAAEGVNHFSAYDVQIPYAGLWDLEVLVDTAPGTTVRFATQVPVWGR